MIDLEDFKLIIGEIIVHTSKAPTHARGRLRSPHAGNPHARGEPPAGGGPHRGAVVQAASPPGAVQASDSGQFHCFYMEFTTKCIFK